MIPVILYFATGFLISLVALFILRRMNIDWENDSDGMTEGSFYAISLLANVFAWPIFLGFGILFVVINLIRYALTGARPKF